VAPAPGSAVLSGIVVTAGIIGLIRFMPDGAPMGEWGVALAVAGLFTAYYGVAVGITQRHPKRALAYSTVSQMGVVAAILGAGLEVGDEAVMMIAAFYAVNHMLLKGAMFLTVGVAALGGPSSRRLAVVVMALLGLSLAGLPLTGGALAKYAAKGVVMSGITEFLLILSAAGTTLLLAHTAALLAQAGVKNGDARPMFVPWLVLVGIALALPFALFPAVTGQPVGSILTPGTALKGILPIALGLGASTLLFSFSRSLREIPAGDLLALAGRASPVAAAPVAWAVRIDAILRRWTVATLSVVILMLFLVAIFVL
jgi:formate hydrogenlyase subunit 3/multisubunit Na+/H+ antiporter MnhD subunit